jgi:hypothetical protein
MGNKRVPVPVSTGIRADPQAFATAPVINAVASFWANGVWHNYRANPDAAPPG